jgi:Protein of unknown function (DUF3040)
MTSPPPCPLGTSWCTEHEPQHGRHVGGVRQDRRHRCARPRPGHGMVLLVSGLVLTQATLVVGLIVSVTGFLSMVGGVALIIRRLRT